MLKTLQSEELVYYNKNVYETTSNKEFSSGLNTFVIKDDFDLEICHKLLTAIASCYGANTIKKLPVKKENNIVFDIIGFEGEWSYRLNTDLPNHISEINSYNNYILPQKLKRLAVDKEYYSFEPLSGVEVTDSFFRIDKLYNYSNGKPIKTQDSFSDREDISLFFTINLGYEDIYFREKNVEPCKEKKIAFDTLGVIENESDYKSDLLKSINKSIKEYESDLLKSIKKMDDLLDRIDNSLKTSVFETSESVAGIDSEIFRTIHFKQLNMLKRSVLYTNLETQKLSDKSYEELKEYFPDANYRKLEAVDKFHKDLYLILREEVDQEIKKTGEIINELNNQIDKIRINRQGIESNSFLPSEMILELKKLSKSIADYENKIKIAKEYKQLEETITKASQEFNNGLNGLKKKIESRINSFIEKHLKDDFKREQIPLFSITDNRESYSYKHASGHNVEFGTTEMILFDLSVLNATSLNVLVHDVFMYDDVSESDFEIIMKMYSKYKKQIFITIKEDMIGSEEVKEIVDRTRIVWEKNDYI